tara:strand:- start:17 stop:1306 length:1290 start_codon:yes stop_codon:yes gene_type:complete
MSQLMRTNWAGNYTYRARAILEPATLSELQQSVATSDRVKALGSRHSFNGIADTAGIQISLARLNRVLAIDHEARTVRVEGGVRYGELAPVLEQEGFALPNLASLPHISIAGAISTATHGSGSLIGNLATQVTALEVVGSKGDLWTASKAETPNELAAAVVSLGSVGIFASVTLAIEPRYSMRQDVYLGLSHDQLAAEFAAIFDSGTSVSVFTTWRGEQTSAIWVKQRMDWEGVLDLADLAGVVKATTAMHPLPDGGGGDCTTQLGRVGPWYKRLPHFKMDFEPSHGAEIQTEYFIPYAYGPQAVAAMRTLGGALAPVLMISELRTIAADGLWLSPGFRGPSLAIHFTFKRDPIQVAAVLLLIETVLSPFGAVPHWGKVTRLAPQAIVENYEKFGCFKEFARDMDPDQVFTNEYLDLLFDVPVRQSFFG